MTIAPTAAPVPETAEAAGNGVEVGIDTVGVTVGGLNVGTEVGGAALGAVVDVGGTGVAVPTWAMSSLSPG